MCTAKLLGFNFNWKYLRKTKDESLLSVDQDKPKSWKSKALYNFCCLLFACKLGNYCKYWYGLPDLSTKRTSNLIKTTKRNINKIYVQIFTCLKLRRESLTKFMFRFSQKDESKISIGCSKKLNWLLDVSGTDILLFK